MSLSNVWLETLGDGLIRADMVIGVRTHPTPAVAGKPSRWLLDVVVPAATGSGLADSWVVGPTHRTLIQTDREPTDGPRGLATLLAQLDSTDASGVITVSAAGRGATGSGMAGVGTARRDEAEAESGGPGGRGGPGGPGGREPVVRLNFTPFPSTE